MTSIAYEKLGQDGLESGFEFHALSYKKPSRTSVVWRIILVLALLCLIGSAILILVYLKHSDYVCGVGIDTKGSCGQMEIVSREEWGARPPKETPTKILPTNMTFLHHSAGPQCSDKKACMKVVKNIQNFHMDTRGWDDIGYNFLVGEDGRVYEGRGWLVEGAHAPTYNANSHGICILGNFMTQLPNQAALTTAKCLMVYGVEKGYINSDYELFGHRDGRCTDCPGDDLYANLQSWSHYSTRKIPIYCP